MKRAGRLLGRAAFSAGVAASLGFGAREAVSAPAGPARGFCQRNSDCVPTCSAQYPGEELFYVRCVSGTCHCIQ